MTRFFVSFYVTPSTLPPSQLYMLVFLFLIYGKLLCYNWYIQTQTMSVRNVYMDDGETDTEEFTILKKCLECEIEHYHDITKAKLVSTFF